LKTGDYIEGKAPYSIGRNSFVVEEAKKMCGSVRFDSIEGLRPNRVLRVGGLEFKLGERVLLATPKPFDRIEDIANIAKEIKDVYKVALLIDESDDMVEYLQNIIDDIYLTKVNYSIQKQTVACLLALFRAKAMVEKGEDVILFVDSLNKLFKIYNNSAYPDGCIDPAKINLGPLVDLKIFVMSSRSLKNNGSLTVISYMNVAENPIEGYIYNEFADIVHKIIKRG